MINEENEVRFYVEVVTASALDDMQIPGSIAITVEIDNEKYNYSYFNKKLDLEDIYLFSIQKITEIMNEIQSNISKKYKFRLFSNNKPIIDLYNRILQPSAHHMYSSMKIKDEVNNLNGIMNNMQIEVSFSSSNLNSNNLRNTARSTLLDNLRLYKNFHLYNEKHMF